MASSEKYQFIINPNSGRRNIAQIEKRIDEVCEGRDIDYDIHITKRPGHASEIARKLVSDRMTKQVIFAVGGDGTMNEVLNGFAPKGIDAGHSFGIIPNGSSNDFYYSLAQLNDLRPNVDLCTVNGDRHFLNVVGIGFDAQVVARHEEFRDSRIPVGQRFNVAVLETIFKYRPLELSFRFNGLDKTGEFMIVAAGNGQRFGGGYKITPDADIQDGLLDLCFCGRLGKFALLPLVGKVKKGTHGSRTDVEFAKTDSLIIDGNRPLPLNIDGELISSDHFEISVAKQALPIFNDKDFVRSIINPARR